jgi:hypothetical protein
MGECNGNKCSILRFSAIFRVSMEGQRPAKGVIRVSLQCHLLHDLIIALDTIWGDMHVFPFLGKYEKLLFLVVFGEWSDSQFDFICDDPVGRFSYDVSFIGFRGKAIFSR